VLAPQGTPPRAGLEVLESETIRSVIATGLEAAATETR